MPGTQTITFNNLGTTTKGSFSTTLKDGIYLSDVLLNEFNKTAKREYMGETIHTPIERARGNGGTYSRYSVQAVSDKEILDTFTHNRAHYWTDIVVSQTDISANAGRNEKIIDLIGTKVNSAKKTMSYLLSTDIYSGTGASDSIVGLSAAVTTTPTTGSYGGLTRDATATTNYIKNQIFDCTALTSLTMLRLQTLFALCSEGEEHPNIIVTGATAYNAIWALADAKQQLGVQEYVKLGWLNINFNGVPIMMDRNCPAGMLYMLNTKHIYLKIDVTNDMAMTDWLMNRDQMAKVKKLTWTGQLVMDNPRYQGVMFGLT